MKSKNLWLDRGLVYGTYLALCLNEKEFKAALNDFKLPYNPQERWIVETHNACTHTWDNTEKVAAPVCIVCLDKERLKDEDPLSIATLLVHEAVHVWQVAEKAINGKQEDELEAYAVQNISGQLMNAYRNSL